MKLHLSNRLLQHYIQSQVKTHKKNEEFRNFIVSLLRYMEPNQMGEKDIIF